MFELYFCVVTYKHERCRLMREFTDLWHRHESHREQYDNEIYYFYCTREAAARWEIHSDAKCWTFKYLRQVSNFYDRTNSPSLSWRDRIFHTKYRPLTHSALTRKSEWKWKLFRLIFIIRDFSLSSSSHFSLGFSFSLSKDEKPDRKSENRAHHRSRLLLKFKKL